jgi:hypothetical protein
MYRIRKTEKEPRPNKRAVEPNEEIKFLKEHDTSSLMSDNG